MSDFLHIPSAFKAGFQGSQLPNNSSSWLSFSRASLAYRTNSNFDLEEMASGVPRLDYKLVQDGIRSCPMWMYEPQRTNLLLRSQEFNIIWSKFGTVNVTSNTNIAPDGSLTADKIDARNSTTFDRIYQQFSVSGNSTHTLSYYALKVESETNYGGINIVYLGNITCSGSAILDAVNGTLNTTSIGGAIVSAKIKSVGDYWRVELTVTDVHNNPTIQCNIFGCISIDGVNIDLGDYSDRVIWNAQLEEGSYATSPIKTEGSKVTRVADSSSLTGLNAKGLIGASEGSIGGEFWAEELFRDDGVNNILLGSGTHRFFIFRGADTPKRRLEFYYNLGSTTLIYGTTQDYNKWLFSWDANGWFLSVNGLVVGSGADVFTFPTDNLTLNGAGGAFQQGTLFMSQTKYTQTEANNYTTL